MRLLLVLLVCSCPGCIKQARTPGMTMHLGQSDEALQEISLQARETFPVFMDKLQNPEPDEQDFLVKYPFEADPGSGFGHEQLWLGDITVEGGIYYGLVSNKPYYISRFKPGDRVSFDKDAVSDWMYIKKGKIIGGYSIKYLIEQIPQPDREPDLRRYYEMFE